MAAKPKAPKPATRRPPAAPPISLTADDLATCVARAKRLALRREDLEHDIYIDTLTHREILKHIALHPTANRTAGSLTLRAMEQIRKLDELLVSLDPPTQEAKRGPQSILEDALVAGAKQRTRAGRGRTRTAKS